MILIRAERGLKLSIIAPSDRATIRESIRTSISYSAYEYLLHHLHHYTPHEAQWWSRGRAYVTEEISPAMWGLMKVAGKRLYQVSADELDHLWFSLDPKQRASYLTTPFTIPLEDLGDFDKETPTSFASLTEAGQWLNGYVTTHNALLLQRGEGEVTSSDRRWVGTRRVVGAMVLNKDLTLIALSMNHPSRGHTSHAERVLLESPRMVSQSQPLQSSTLHLISTLKPCKMCAGLWVTHAPFHSLKTYYLRDDPGRNGQNTALDQGSYAWEEAKRWRCIDGEVSQERLIID